MKKLWIGIIVVIVVLAGFFFMWKRKAGSLNQPRYETVKVERGNIEVKVLSTGTVQPYTRVEIRSPVRGRIDKVEVDEGDIVKEGNILAWISSEDRIALLDAARSTLETAQKEKDEETTKEAEMAYEVANKAYKPVPLTTSISGEVIKRSCEPGQNVSLESILFVLSDRLVAKVEVDEADIGKISLGEEAWVVLDAFPDERVKAKVTKISREGRIVSDVVIYDVVVNPLKVPPYWASGMTANVEFITERKSDILMIPKSAVKERGGRKFVMVLDEKPSPRRIETGITDGRMTEVTKGLREGETIIAGGIGNNSQPRGALQRSIHMMRGMR